MPTPQPPYDQSPRAPSYGVKEEQIEDQPSEMVDDNKQLFRKILDAFLGRYEIVLPDIFESPTKKKAGVATA